MAYWQAKSYIAEAEKITKALTAGFLAKNQFAFKKDSNAYS